MLIPTISCIESRKRSSRIRFAEVRCKSKAQSFEQNLGGPRMSHSSSGAVGDSSYMKTCKSSPTIAFVVQWLRHHVVAVIIHVRFMAGAERSFFWVSAELVQSVVLFA